MMHLTGGCRCGAIRYEAHGTPRLQVTCHCRDCQYAAGGAPTHAVIMRTRDVTVTKGEPRAYAVTADSGERIERLFCPECGTPLFARNPAHPEMLPIKVGSLDDPGFFRPQAEIWVRSAQPWQYRDPAVPQFRGNPKIGPELLVKLGRASLAKLGRLAGIGRRARPETAAQ